MILLKLIGISCFAFIFTSVITKHLPTFLKTKPFTCESCLSFWIALASFSEYGINSLWMASLSYVIASILWKL